MPLATTLLVLAALSTAPEAEPGPDSAAEQQGRELFQRYQDAVAAQRGKQRNVSMQVEIDATIPNLSKSGKMRAIRTVDSEGSVTYKGMEFEGDDLVKRQVIARYLEAEKEATAKAKDVGINTANYKFKYQGEYGSGDWKLHLFELSPIKKRIGLLKGWLWVEAKSLLPVREIGEFVKSPSLWLKKISITRDYELRDGASVCVKIETTTVTRVVGAAQVVTRYSNFSEPAAVPASAE